jgi:hypothetical protein
LGLLGGLEIGLLFVGVKVKESGSKEPMGGGSRIGTLDPKNPVPATAVVMGVLRLSSIL